MYRFCSSLPQITIKKGPAPTVETVLGVQEGERRSREAWSAVCESVSSTYISEREAQVHTGAPGAGGPQVPQPMRAAEARASRL